MALPTFKLSDFTTGSNGFTINGVNPFDTSGFSISKAGDVNNDGIGDIVVGAPGSTFFSDPDPTNTPGNVYVVFGNKNGFPDELELSALDGTNGFVIEGIAANDFTGTSVSSAGDVNNDGIDDMVIGAREADPNNLTDAGKAYVVYGSNSGFAPTLDLSDLNGDNGFTINGLAAGNQTGNSVTGLGDINGDGIDDLGIGALYADPNNINNAGVGYVVFGNQNGFSDNFDLNTLNGTNGFTIEGIAEGNETGINIKGVGDFNGDGIDDLAITAPFADPNGNIDAGSTYLIFGTQAGFAPTLNLGDLNGANGIVFNGVAEGDFLGKVDAADVNGDGFTDLIMGAYAPNSYNNPAGSVHVVFGSSGPFSEEFNLSQLDGTNGFTIEGITAGNLTGFSVSSAGDFNGDKVDDFLIGAPGTNNFAGQSYLVYGKENGFAAKINLDELGPTDGLALNGVNAYDFSAISVSAAGDIDGDGFDDVMVGASYDDPDGRTNAGSTSVIYGRATITGTEGNDSLYATDKGSTIYAGEGNDTLCGGNGVNILLGEEGNDLIYGGPNADYISGGEGNDRLYGSGGDNQIFGNEGNDSIFAGSGNNFIDGGAGRNHIWLGDGGRGKQQVVVVNSSEGFNIIDNFQAGQTKLGLYDGLTFNDLNIVQRGNSTLIEDSAGNDLARLNDVTIIIGATDFVSV